MASDSRLTYNKTTTQGRKTTVNSAIGLSDTNYKTFLTHNDIGISTSGQASIQGVPIAGYIESFINGHISAGNFNVEQTTNEFLTYFRGMSGPPNIFFIVAGYQQNDDGDLEQHVWLVEVRKNKSTRVNPPNQQGASWSGQSDVLTRLIQPVFIQDSQGNYNSLPHHPITWGVFTLQDSIDYARYAIKTTIDTMRFHPRPKTVGGPIDILVIKPNEAFWIARKELH